MSNNHATPQATMKAAVVVPMSNRAELTPDEALSLSHLTHYLGRYDKYLVVPQTLQIAVPEFHLARFDNNYFGSAAANTRLMLSTSFYERFQQYEYILVYHLDALVFSDQLEKWCDRGFDYIGPPWQETADTPWVKEPGVGNGGFCLRKVSSCLKVLNSTKYAIEPDRYWEKYCAANSRFKQLANLPRKYLKQLRLFNSVKREVSKFHKNEDIFWATRATHYYPAFKIAPVDVALQFAFEGAPRDCFKENNNTLPFGCHAWPKYDRSFWEPHLLTQQELAVQMQM